MKRKSFLCFLLILFLLTGCDSSTNEAKNSSGGGKSNPDTALSDSVDLAYAEAAALATHVITATFLGTEEVNGNTEYRFHPETILKGTLPAEETSQIFLVSDKVLSYIPNTCYLLVLEKNVSVYYPHSRFVSIYEPLIAQDDAAWSDYQAVAAASGTPNAESYGNAYTEASDPETVSAFATDIYVATVAAVFAEGRDNTTTYRCIVTKTIRNQPGNTGYIFITLQNGTVTVGNEYLFLLSDTSGSAPVYSVASRNGSVYGLDEAASVPVLAKLLSGAADYTAVDPDLLSD